MLNKNTSSTEEIRVAFLDDIIRDNLHQFFPQHKESYAITLSRDAELYIEDEYEGDLIEKLYQAVQQRDRGMPIRFLYDLHMPDDLLLKLKELFGLTQLDFIPGGRYHHFHDFFQFGSLVDQPHLQYEPMPPLPHPYLEQAESLLELIWQKDQVLHFPYQRFDYLPNMVAEAIDSDDCRHIKMTLYRTSKDSVVGKTLLTALDKGKKVTVFIEAKARFDEENNIYWGNRLSEAGAVVIFSYPGIKVHSKLLLVEFEDPTQDIAYIGTGNFNENTARVYTDHALITSRPKLTAEVNRIFRILDRSMIIPRAKNLLVSPFTTRSGIEERIDREIRHVQAGKSAAIFFKMNSLEDKKMASKLQEAAAAGVRVRLIVRGICILNTNYIEEPNRIEAISVVDRFLEHPRLYHFLNDKSPELFIGSADLMERNLDRRIEVLAPILDQEIFQELMEIMELQWLDNTKARVLDGSLSNAFRKADRSREKIHSQYDTYAYLKAKLEE